MPTPPPLDEKVITTDDGGWSVAVHEEPGSMPASPTVKLKEIVQTEDLHYVRSDDKITWLERISIFAHVEVYDGESLFWRWSAVDGDIIGGP